MLASTPIPGRHRDDNSNSDHQAASMDDQSHSLPLETSPSMSSSSLVLPPVNALLARVRQASFERPGASTPKSDETPRPSNPTTNRAQTPETPTTVKGILRKPDTPSTNSRVVWGFRMTTEGDVSKISSLADSPTRSLTPGESENGGEAQRVLSPPESSRALQVHQARSNINHRSAHDSDDEDAVEASLPSLPSTSTLERELEADQYGADESRFAPEKDGNEHDDPQPFDESASRLPPLVPDSEETSAMDLMNDSIPSMATIHQASHDTSSSAMKTPRPRQIPSREGSTQQPKSRSSNVSPNHRLLPWGKQSPGSRIAKSSAGSSSSSGLESSFSVNDSMLAREAVNFMKGWKEVESAGKQSKRSAVEAQAAQDSAPSPAEQAHVVERGSSPSAQEQDRSEQEEAESEHEAEEHNVATGATSDVASPPQHAFDWQTPSRVSQKQSSSIAAWQEDVSHHDLATPNRPHSTFPSPASGLDSAPNSERRSNLTNELSFSTAFISSPAAQRAQRKSLKELVDAAPFPSSRKSVPRRVSPPAALPSPKRIKEEQTSPRWQESPAPSVGAASYKTAQQTPWRNGTPASSSRQLTTVSKMLHRASSSSPSPQTYDDAEAAKRLTAVRDAIEEYISAHDERLGTLSSRALAHRSEASHLRTLLHEELESKCQILSDLNNSRLETQEWKRRVDKMRAECENERALQSQSDENLRKLVEKMREQLQRRAASVSVSVKSEPEDALEKTVAQDVEIQQLREELDRERQERAREQKDYEIRIAIAAGENKANLSVSPRFIPLPASRESSPLQDSPVRPSQQILEDAVRRARESAERDHEIRLYSMQRDHEQALEALEEELDSVRSQMEGETLEQVSELKQQYEERIEALEEQLARTKEQLGKTQTESIEARQVAEQKVAELEAARGAPNQLEEAHGKLQERLRNAEGQLESLTATVTDLDQQLDTERQNTKAAINELHDLQEQHESLKAERREIEEDLTGELERRQQSWTQDIQSVEREREEALQYIVELEERGQALEEELNQLDEERQTGIDEMQAEKEALQRKIEDLEADVNAQQVSKTSGDDAASKTNVSLQVERLQEQLGEADEQRRGDLVTQGKLQVANERLERQIRDLEAAVEELEEQLTARQEDLAHAQAALSEVQSNPGVGRESPRVARELEAELKLVRLDLDETRKSREESQKRLGQMQSELERLQIRSETLEKEVGDRGLSVSKLQRANERLEVEIQNHSIALATKQQELSLLKRKMRISQPASENFGTRNAVGPPRLVSMANDSRSTVDEEQTTEILEKGPAPHKGTRRRTMDPAAAVIGANAALRNGNERAKGAQRAASTEVRSHHAPLRSSSVVNRAAPTQAKTSMLGKRSSPSEPARDALSFRASESTASESVRSSSVASSKSKHSTYDMSAVTDSRQSGSMMSHSDMDLIEASRSRSSSRASEWEGSAVEYDDDATATGIRLESSRDMSLEELTRLSRNSRVTQETDDEEDKENGSMQATPKAAAYRGHERQLKRTESMASISSVASTASRSNATGHRKLNEIPGMESFLARRAPQGGARAVSGSSRGVGAASGAGRRPASKSPELHRNRSRAMVPA